MGTLNVQPLVFITDEDYKLEQNYPNPFNPTTSIRFTLPTAENISLIVYDINGREVRNLIDSKFYEKGSYETSWDGKNENGKTVASGNYFYKLKWGNFEKSMKMTYLK
jgi:flagellar hook assembly protein FlgD